MEVRIADCPLDKKCEEVREVKDSEGTRQVLYRCPWFERVIGKHPQIPDTQIDQWKCSVAWLPLLLIENTKEAIELTSSHNGLRNALAEALPGLGLVELLNDGAPPMKEIGDMSDRDNT